MGWGEEVHVAEKRKLWLGWVAFAAVMMFMSGLFNAITGLTAVFSDEVYIGPHDGVLVLDLTAWGWVHVLLGTLMVATAAMLLFGAMWARLVTVVLVCLNMVTQLSVLPAYPFWGLLLIAVDILVVWTIIVHGDEIADA
jgi:hypothetical protein